MQRQKPLKHVTFHDRDKFCNKLKHLLTVYLQIRPLRSALQPTQLYITCKRNMSSLRAAEMEKKKRKKKRAGLGLRGLAWHSERDGATPSDSGRW